MHEIKTYDSIGDAFIAMEELDPCVDNHRIAEISDSAQLQAYVRQQSKGCCGQFDGVAMVKINGYPRMCLIGCNYGH
jgi:hypothetical protein